MKKNKDIVKSKLCFNPIVARECIHEGCEVCDTKPYRDDPERSILVFKDDELFRKVFSEATARFKESESKYAENGKLCYDPCIARKCIQAGCKVIDAKLDINNPKKTIFVFEDNELFRNTFEAVIAELKDKEEPIERPEMAD